MSNTVQDAARVMGEMFERQYKDDLRGWGYTDAQLDGLSFEWLAFIHMNERYKRAGKLLMRPMQIKSGGYRLGFTIRKCEEGY